MEKRSIKMVNIILLFVYICLSVLGVLLVKMGGTQQLEIAEGSIVVRVGIHTLLGLLCYVASFLLYMIVIPRFNLSYISPITTGAVFTLVILVSMLVLKETIGLFQWIGISAILFGIIMMNIKK